MRLCRNNEVFNDRKVFSYEGFLLVKNYATFMIGSTTCGELSYVYEGVYTVAGHDDGYFYPTLMVVDLHIDYHRFRYLYCFFEYYLY
jgi:hypothetical protein